MTFGITLCILHTNDHHTMIIISNTLSSRDGFEKNVYVFGNDLIFGDEYVMSTQWWHTDQAGSHHLHILTSYHTAMNTTSSLEPT